MKKLLSLVVLFALLILTGCSDDAAPTNSGGLGGGGLGGGGNGGGGGNVTVTIALATDQQGQYYFEFKPNTGIVVASVRAVCTAAQVDETVQVNDGNVYNNTNPLYIGPVQGLQQGQQWQFTLTGKVGSTTGANFTSNANFTVQ